MQGLNTVLKSAPVICEKNKSVLIIGSSGFLGPHIVSSLLDTAAPSKLYCLNRSISAEQRTLSALKSIRSGMEPNFSSIHFILSDITKPNLGLEDTLAMLLDTVDEVIFNAWSPNWGLDFEFFEPLLKAVQNTIDLAQFSPRSPRITFVSSICAIGEWPRQHPFQPLIPEGIAQDISNAMAHGYGKSKWMAEQLLEHANSSSGVYVSIVRVGQIGGSVSNENHPWPVQGWILSIITASKKVGYWPTHVQPLDWIPVDSLAKGITTVVNGPRAQGIQIYNMVHPNPASWDLLRETLQKNFGLNLISISLPDWLDLFRPESFRLYDFLREARIGREFDMVFNTTNACRVLPSVANITMNELTAWLRSWELLSGEYKCNL